MKASPSGKAPIDAEGRGGPIEIEEARSSIEQLLRALIKIGVAIRQAGNTSRLDNADRSFTKHMDDYRAFVEELILSMWITQMLYSKERLKISKKEQVILPEVIAALQDEDLQREHGRLLSAESHRLVWANARRRHRFIFAERRANKLKPSKKDNDREA